MKRLISLILLLSIPYSQTDVSGVVSGTWTLEDSPYNVIGDVDIITTLIIEPGVEINYSSGSNAGFKINVFGLLTANGTIDTPILISNSSDAYDSNGGTIIFNNSWDGSSVSDIIFQDVGYPMHIIGNTELSVSNLTINNCWSVFGNSTNNNPTDIGDLLLNNLIINGSVGWHNGELSPALIGGVLDDINITNSYGILLYNPKLINNITLTDNFPLDGQTNHNLYGYGFIYINSYNSYFNETEIKSVIATNNNCQDDGLGVVDIINIDATGIFMLQNLDFQSNVCNGISVQQGTFNSNNLLITENTYGTAYKHGSNSQGQSTATSNVHFSTFVNNYRDISAGQNFSLFNSISYFNEYNNPCNQGMYVENCCMQQECFAGENSNIYSNPMFINFDDYSVHESSPIIDAGNSSYGIDVCFPPSMGTSTPDIGHNGGPGACDWDESDEPSISGCTDSTANNYNPNATVDDGTCEYDENWVYGCTYENGTNYNSDATFDDGSCEFMWGDFNQDGTLNVIDIVAIVEAILSGNWF